MQKTWHVFLGKCSVGRIHASVPDSEEYFPLLVSTLGPHVPAASEPEKDLKVHRSANRSRTQAA